MLTPSKGGLSSPPNPPQVAAGASKPPLDAAMLVRPTQRSAQYIWPPPDLLFLVGSFRPAARRVRLDKWEKTRRIKAGREGGELDGARQRSIRAMVARLHLPALPFSHLSAHIQPRLGFKQKHRVWLPQKDSCPRSPSPPHPSTSPSL